MFGFDQGVIRAYITAIPVVVIWKAEAVEKIFGSKKHVTKRYPYTLAESFVAKGLVTRFVNHSQPLHWQPCIFAFHTACRTHFDCSLFSHVSNAEQWQMRRKMLTPTFHFRILQDFLCVFNDYARTFTRILAEHDNAFKPVDIVPLVSMATLDIVCGKHLLDVFF